MRQVELSLDSGKLPGWNGESRRGPARDRLWETMPIGWQRRVSGRDVPTTLTLTVRQGQQEEEHTALFTMLQIPHQSFPTTFYLPFSL